MDVDIDDDHTFNLIQPTLFQQMRNILDQFPDDGQILKVKRIMYKLEATGMYSLIPGPTLARAHCILFSRRQVNLTLLPLQVYKWVIMN